MDDATRERILAWGEDPTRPWVTLSADDALALAWEPELAEQFFPDMGSAFGAGVTIGMALPKP